MKLRRVLEAILLFLAAFVALLLLLVIIPFIWLSLWVFDIPNKIGKRWGMDDHFRRILYRTVYEKEIKYFRDEFMEVLQSKIEYREGIERWGLEREIDVERKRAIEDLHQGEQIIAILGATLTIVIGNIFGIGWAALALTTITLFYSIAVAFRILVVDALAYSSVPHKEAPIRELAKMKAWNEGPLRGTGGVGVIILSLITSRGSLGADLGMKVTDIISDSYFKYDMDKWRDNEEGPWE